MEEKMKELVRERDRAVQENEDLSERAQRRQVQLPTTSPTRLTLPALVMDL